MRIKSVTLCEGPSPTFGPEGPDCSPPPSASANSRDSIVASSRSATGPVALLLLLILLSLLCICFFKSTNFPSKLCGRNLCSCPSLGVGVAVAGAGPSIALGLEAGEDGVEALAAAVLALGVPGRLGDGRERRTASSYARYTTGADA